MKERHSQSMLHALQKCLLNTGYFNKVYKLIGII